MVDVMLASTAILPAAELKVAPVKPTMTPRPAPPISFRASDAPTEMPMPTAPTASEAAADMTLASMLAAPFAETTIPVWPEMFILSMRMLVRVLMALLLSAPAPLTAIPPTPKPAASATDAARDRIVAVSAAPIFSAPVVALTTPAAPLSALRMIWLEVVLEMVLTAIVAAIAPEMPTIPPAMLKATAPATASMDALLAA